VSAALFLSVIATANSPSTVIAVVTELRARGRMTESILGVTVLKDLLVIVMFAGVLTVCSYLNTVGGSLDTGLIFETAWRLGASIAGGVILGFLLIFYIDRVRAELALFMIGISFISTELFHHFGLHPLLATVVAGFVVQNFSDHGSKFIESLERASLPIFVIFFAIAGAGLDLSSLRAWWVIVLVLLLSRALLIYCGTALGAVAAGETRSIRRLSWLGFLPQAGVSLGLAVLVTQYYPEWGEFVKDVAISMIALNQILGPVGLKYALVRSGEAHAGGGDEVDDTGPITPFHVMMRSHRF
jgi:Kef-type K+ transport system membrane component KefB